MQYKGWQLHMSAQRMGVLEGARGIKTGAHVLVAHMDMQLHSLDSASIVKNGIYSNEGR